MNKDKSVEQNEKVILSLKDKLEKEGFKTTWQNPSLPLLTLLRYPLNGLLRLPSISMKSP